MKLYKEERKKKKWNLEAEKNNKTDKRKLIVNL